MGRYSPTVHPEPIDFGGIAEAFLSSLDRRRQRKREEKDDAEDQQDREEVDLDRRIRRSQLGVREGTPPADDGYTATIPGPPDIPESLDFDVAPRRPAPMSPLEDESFGQALAQELATGGPMPRAAGGAGSGRSPLQESPTLPAQLHPGAFDPATRTFGGSPLQLATAIQALQSGGREALQGRQVNLGPTGRYTQIDDDHYIDETATPSAERHADRMTQMEMAAAFRERDIGLRGDEREEIERLRQTGRAETQGTRDDRADRRSEAHDTRVTSRTRESDRTRASTANQREDERDADRRDAAILRRAQELTKPQKDGVLSKPGLAWEQALSQATKEVGATLGGGAAQSISATSATPTIPTPEKAAEDAWRLIEQGAGTLEQALASPALSRRAKDLLRARAARPR